MTSMPGLKGAELEISHPAETLHDVMSEVLRSGTDISHCFLNIGELRAHLGIFQEHFMPNDPERRIIYATKANPRNQILQTLVDAGIDGFDCASAHEIMKSLALSGIGPDQIYFNNPVKRRDGIEFAFQQGIKYFTAQSRSGVDKILGKFDSQQPDDLEVAVRIETPNPDAKIDLSMKYGCSPDDGIELLNHLKRAGINSGLAMHTGSQNTNADTFIEGINLLTQITTQSSGVCSINLGGGLPVNYSRMDRHDIKHYLKEITKTVNGVKSQIFKNCDSNPQIIIEPGRALVANSINLAIPVLELDKHRGKKRAYIDDGVFTSFSDAVIHKWQYYFDVFTKDGRRSSENLEPYTIYGRTCDSGDVIGEFPLPDDLKEGDFLWVKNAGAYMDSQASSFNGFGVPKYVIYNTN